MMRWLRNILKAAGAATAMLSALLCVVSLGMWARSYSRLDQVVHTADRPDRLTMTMGSTTGIVYISVVTPPFARFDDSTLPGWEYASYPDPFSLSHTESLLGRLGFGYGSFHDPQTTMRVWQAFVPHWFLAMLFACAPLGWLIRQRRRIPAGHCQTCGYDLRETPQRCPECGTSARGTLP